jgi:hypothetical protein
MFGPYYDKDLVVRREGTVFRILRSRFHRAGDLLSRAALDDASRLTTKDKIVILPEGSVG